LQTNFLDGKKLNISFLTYSEMLDQLPLDILRYILQMPKPGWHLVELVMLKLVCKRLNLAIPRQKPYTYLMSCAMGLKNLNIIQYLHKNNYKWNAYTCQAAIRLDSVKIFEYLYKNRIAINDTDKSMRYVRYGTLYLFKVNMTYNEAAIEAAHSRKTAILEYMYYSGILNNADELMKSSINPKTIKFIRKLIK
jgi:hypothetical protein